MELQKDRSVQQLSFLQGGGEMGALTRAYDWRHSTLGMPGEWPQSLRITLGIVLHSAFPMFLFWGDALTCFYNDAFRPSLGIDGKHPAVGKRGEEVWADIWTFIGPLIQQVMRTGEPVWFEDQLVAFYRNGRQEDIYWTFSYSPVFGDDGGIQGVLVTCTETTAKVQMVKKLSASEKRFQALVRDATIGIVVLTGADMVVDIVNAAYGKLIGRDHETLSGRPIFDIIPEAAPYFKSIIENVRVTGEPHYLNDHPYFIFAGDRKIEGYLNLVYQPYREDDHITGIIILAQDVTEQVLAKQAVEKSEQQVRQMMESAPFPIGVYIGREMRIQHANQSIIDVWGKGPDVIGKLYAEILPELHDTGIYAQLDQVFSTGEPFHMRNARVPIVVDGRLQPFYFNYSFTPLYDAAGNIYGVMNTAAEVTDLTVATQQLERSERNLRTMIMQSPVAMCILTGPKFVIEVANELMVELWGKGVEAVMGKPVFDALPDARAQGLEKLMEDVYHTGVAFKADEHPVQLFRNGKWDTVYQNFVYEAYRDAEGAVIGILVVTIDVTAQVLARQQIEEVVAARTKALAEVNNNLKRSNAELAQFAYIASHDLQEPVRKVSNFAQMLERNLHDHLDERSIGYIGKIKNSASRMLALIKDVLTYSELSNVKPEFAPVSLQRVVEDIRTDFELLIDQKQARVWVCDLPEIEAIPLQMVQLFGNLVSNALKYARPSEPPEIDVCARQVDAIAAGFTDAAPDAVYYEISVQDNGIGFSQEYASQIFHIFQRLHGKTDYEGTGIGLAICQKIVLNHHGTIFAQSEAGKGSRFVVVLPARQPR